MNIKPIEVKVGDDREFWERWVGIYESAFMDRKMPKFLKELYVDGLLQEHEEPFIGSAFRSFLSSLEVKGKPSDYFTVASYKSQLKKYGWLNKDGSLIKNIAQIRRAYMKEREYGIRSINFLFKMYVSTE